MEENDLNTNKIFNNVIDNLFNENITYTQLSQMLIKKEITNFFLLILNEFGSNPDDIRGIFNNTNPKNKNLNMIFKENANNLLTETYFNDLNFMQIFIDYINYSLDLPINNLSHLYICYKTCKKLITNSYIVQNTEKKLSHIQKSVMELCFNCPNKYPFLNSEINNNNYEIKRRFILKKIFLAILIISNYIMIFLLFKKIQILN